MPIIQGQKMACEPCIRGHRSTKCGHANERLMVPVRKPGRPLSICPHPPTRQCGCGGVTAAIPRRQTCHCGPNGGQSQETTAAETTPSSPAKTTSTSSGQFPGRIQKPSKAPTRKHSIDPSTLERVDVDQINVLSPYEDRKPDQTTNGVPSTTVPASMASELAPMALPMMPTHAALMGQMMYPMYARQMSAPAVNQPEHAPHTNGLNGVHGEGSVAAAAQSPQVLASPVDGTVNGTAASHHRRSSSISNGVMEPKPRSCCQPAPSSPEVKASPGLVHAPPIAQNGAAGMPTMPPNHSPYPPFFPQPTVFTYPPHYGSYMYPLLPELWRQAMTSMTAGAMAPNMVNQQNINFVPDNNPQTPTMGISHMCTCGDGCQCIGCAAHPYNDATQNYVRSAWNFMTEAGWTNGVNGINSAISTMPPIGELPTPTTSTADILSKTIPTENPELRSPATNGVGPVPAPVATAAHNQNQPSPKSPTAPQTPSDSASLASEEQQTLSASDFFFVTYPFDETCVGDTASCPCGDDCQCIGCVVHGNSRMQAIPGESPTVPPS